MELNRRKLFKPLCKACPLSYEKLVPAIGPSPRAFLSGLVILGEAPGKEESIQGEPFVGAAGRLLNSLLGKAGGTRKACWITNVLPCRPPSNDISSPEAKEALDCCSQALEKEMERLKDFGSTCIVALGQTAMKACGVDGAISFRRGYVYESRFGLPVVPSYHPAYILRGNSEDAPTLVADISKALEIARFGWTKPTFRMNIFPTVKDVEILADQLARKKALVGVDIETTALLAHKGELFMIGIADSPTSATVVPFLCRGYKPYWRAGEEARVKKALQRIFSSCKLVFHNALFDVGFLEAKGFKISSIAHDTMLLAHCIHPEQFSRLSFVASIYDSVPYWKNTLEDKEVASADLPDVEFREYNARDAIELLRILPPMLSDAEILGVKEVYEEISLKLIRPVLAMQERGLLIDKKKLAQWRGELQEKLSSIEKFIKQSLNLPDSFSLRSAQHVVYLIYGLKPESIEAKIADYKARQKEIEDLIKQGKTAQALRKKQSKVFKSLEELACVFSIKPFSLPASAPKHRTDSGQISIDETAIESLLIWIRSKGEQSKASSSKASQEKLESFLVSLLDYRATDKLLSTYGDFSTWPDGRVHFPYKITGTATGRLSSGDKKNLGVGNAQNIPEEARKVFVAADGYVLIGADYASLEPRMLAYLSHDEPLIEDFKAGIKIYDSIIRDTLGIDKTHPQYKSIRDAIKVYVLATNYGGGLQTVWRNMRLKCKDLPFSFADLKRIHQRRLELHPAYKAYYDNLVKTIQTERVLRNAFGRRRVFLGPDSSIIREALDYGPQSSGADLVNQAMIRIHARLAQENLDAFLVIQLHDALYIESSIQDAKQAASILVEEMERPVQIGSYKNVSFPTELKVGFSWGEMVEVQLSEIDQAIKNLRLRGGGER